MINRVVVSGAGAICSIGAGVEDYEKALFAGDGSPRPGTLGEEAGLSGVYAYEVPEFDAGRWLGKKGLRMLDRAACLLCVSARLALDSARLQEQAETGGYPQAGLVNGTMFGSIHSIASFDWSGLVDSPKFVNPMAFPNTVINSPAGQAGIKFGLRAVNSTISTGLASGLCAIQYGAELLGSGRAEALLAGGADQWSPECYLGFRKNGLLSPSNRLQPFGESRDGTVLGEGSALLVLELDEKARSRGVEPWAYLAGFGESFDPARSERERLRARGLTRAIEEALESSSCRVDEVALIVSSANGGRLGDAVEASALRQVFCGRLSEIPICAPKACWGEAQGASGALQALTAILALRRGQAPPTPDAGPCLEDLPLSSQPQPLKGRRALVISHDCEGTSAALVLGI